MGSGALIKDVWHREALTLSQRNAIMLRRWGMRVTVYNDPNPANNGDYVLTYNQSSTNKNDNGNWVLVSWSGGGGGISRVDVDTSNPVIILDFANQAQRMFTGVPAINGPRTWQLDNDANALTLQFKFTLTGLDAQTMPPDFIMSDAAWNAATNTWTPFEPGEYNATAFYDGTNWNLSIIGPYT